MPTCMRKHDRENYGWVAFITKLEEERIACCKAGVASAKSIISIYKEKIRPMWGIDLSGRPHRSMSSDH